MISSLKPCRGTAISPPRIWPGIWEEGMRRTFRMFMAIVSVVGAIGTLCASARADDQEPDIIRGQVTAVDAASIVVKTKDGASVSFGLPEGTAIFALSEGSFTKVDFGVYVGAVGVKLDEYSPIVRDSLSWLHQGYELRVIDEELRGIASGHKKWNLTPETIIAHGWVDDMEGRVISIKYGPTEIEETDVEIARDVQVHRMSLGDKSLIKVGAHVTAGAQKDADGKYVAVYIFAGKDGVVPHM